MNAMPDNEFLFCSERHLSRILGIDPGQLNRSLSGAKTLRLSTILRWSETLAIPVGRLVELIIERQSKKQRKHC
jgi:hypothetical protein